MLHPDNYTFWVSVYCINKLSSFLCLYQEQKGFLGILSWGKSNNSFVSFCLQRMMMLLINLVHCCVPEGRDVSSLCAVDRLALISRGPTPAWNGFFRCTMRSCSQDTCYIEI